MKTLFTRIYRWKEAEALDRMNAPGVDGALSSGIDDAGDVERFLSSARGGA